MNRDQLIDMIAGSIRRRITYLDQTTAEACADGLLRDLKAEGLKNIDLDPATAPPAEA